MKTTFYSLLLCGAVIFQSCGPHEEAKWLWEGKTGPLGELYVCCQVAGNSCYEKGSWGYTTTFRNYVANDNLAGYFQNENWQSDFPQLIDQPEIVQAIISNNPKGVFLDNFAFVILKNRNEPPVTDNVLIAFKEVGSPECDKIFSGLPV